MIAATSPHCLDPMIIISRRITKRQSSARPIAATNPTGAKTAIHPRHADAMSMFVLTLRVGRAILPRPDARRHLGLPTRTRCQHGCGSCPARPPGRADGPAGTNDLQGRGWPAASLDTIPHHTTYHFTQPIVGSNPRSGHGWSCTGHPRRPRPHWPPCCSSDSSWVRRMPSPRRRLARRDLFWRRVRPPELSRTSRTR